jgi:glycosyltransferase involved in cell wall biosynthesis
MISAREVRPIRLLLLGPLPPPMGGDTRHFTTLLADLRTNPGYRITHVNTSRGREHSRMFVNLGTALVILLRTAFTLPRVDLVSYHSSDRGMFLFGPLIVGLARLMRRPLILRFFGGSFGDFYETRGRFARWLIRRTLLSSDVVLLQTRRLMRQLAAHASARLVWFSTYITAVAPKPARLGESERPGTDVCRRFVFLGHLWRTKGIETLLEAAAALPPGCSIDIYGSPDDYSADDIARRGHGRVRYRGFLSHDEVNQRLWDYDCLLLPTWHPGEGYPGVIAEAFAHAIPVITTRWMAIPEIVDESCAILVEPRDTAGFLAAVTALHDDRARWRAMCSAAALRARDFDHALWAARFEEICRELAST